MKKAVIRIAATGEQVAITAPGDKEMVFDNGLLQHGILSLGEFGQSGTKIAVFKEWTEASFEPDGYTVVRGYE